MALPSSGPPLYIYGNISSYSCLFSDYSTKNIQMCFLFHFMRINLLICYTMVLRIKFSHQNLKTISIL